jgi:alanine-synthesizing transaminase
MHRACGWRVGWVSLSGPASALTDLERALDLLGALRLCANVPGQWAVEPALRGPDTMTPLIASGGRLAEARRVVIDACATSEFLQLVAPGGALYAFPAVRADAFAGFDDESFALRLLEEEHILVVPGSGFNLAARNHFRVTLLPPPAQLRDVFGRIERCLQRAATVRQSARSVA